MSNKTLKYPKSHFLIIKSIAVYIYGIIHFFFSSIYLIQNSVVTIYK